MFSQRKHIYAQVRHLTDALLFGLALWLAHLLRANWNLPIFRIFGGADVISPIRSYLWLFPFIMVAGPLTLSWNGFYSRQAISSRRSCALQVIKAGTLTTVALVLGLFLAREQSVARSVIILSGLISTALITAEEQLIRWWLQSDWGKSQIQRRFILVGGASDNKRLTEELHEQSPWRIQILDQLDINNEPIEKLPDLLHKHSANGVILNARHAYFGQIEKAIQLCELEGVEAWLMADFFKTQISRTSLDDFANRPMLVFRSTPEESWEALAKNATDFIGALCLMAAASPLFLFAAVAIKLTSPGPIFFKQQRSGLNGKPFQMYKFRSMSTDADQRKHELAAMNEMSGPVFKITHDPRITPVGRILRRFSIDELPQLINVLRGEMSLVGPRPLPVDETRRFDDIAHRRRLSVKPGLTCLWQVSGRNEVTDFKEWVRLDLEYIDNWSIWLDYKILLRTIPAVVWGNGAK
jgi:exopolysaccharide biosynthesis polyprenyl glycosylphosphotransferase